MAETQQPETTEAALLAEQAALAQIWQKRGVRQEEIDPALLLANAWNAAQHPFSQQEALAEALQTLGWIQRVIVNLRTGAEWPEAEQGQWTLVDGHLRVQLALRHLQPTVPVEFVDLNPDEERLALLSINRIAALVQFDPQVEAKLQEQLQSSGLLTERLRELLTAPAQAADAAIIPLDATRGAREPKVPVETLKLTLEFREYKIPLTPEEAAWLQTRIDAQKDAFGILAGFVHQQLMDEAPDGADAPGLFVEVEGLSHA